MKASDDLRSQLARSMGVTTAIGLDLAGVLLVCVLLGRYADSRLGSAPAGLLLGIIIGIIAGGYSAYQLVRRVLR
jgi:F0F1-type ATP synthase assembly protein I